MSATSIIFPKFRAFDNDGAVLDGGKVYTYAAGTTTPLATYTDYNAGTANSNPVILDDSGQADIWLSAAFYKVVLTDKNGVQMWSVDNVGPGPLSSNSNSGFGAATDIASAGLVDLGTIVTHFANITGNQTITSFGASASVASPLYLIKFAGVLTITQSSSLLTPLGTNITTAAQDHAWLEYLGSGSWRIFEYIPSNGTVNLTNVVGTLGIVNGGTGQTSLAAVQGAFSIFQHNTTFTSNGNFTPAFTGRAFVEGWAAGGGGGGTNSTNIRAGGGGGGGYFAGFIDVVSGVNCAVVIGTGGTAGANTGGNGGTGGTTSFTSGATVFSAIGGSGGTGGTATNVSYAGGAGGTASGATLNLTGQSGNFGQTPAGGASVAGGNGGNAPRGGGGAQSPSIFSGSSAGVVGGFPGGGASSGFGVTSLGGVGAAGYVIVYHP